MIQPAMALRPFHAVVCMKSHGLHDADLLDRFEVQQSGRQPAIIHLPEMERLFMSRIVSTCSFSAYLMGMLLLGTPALAEEPQFKKHQLTDKFYCEGAHYGDFNQDGKMDVVSGPYWYAGPDFTKAHEIYTPEPYEPKSYSKNFLCFTGDFNRDSWTDVFVVGFPGDESWWFENPKNQDGHWKRHVAVTVTDNESPWVIDVDGDQQLDLAFHTGGFYGYATVNSDAPEQPWTFHRVSDQIAGGRFQHGYGVGDVNNDGRMDLLFAQGWLEQPESLDGDPLWKLHAFPFAPGGSQMHVYDFDGDGDNDVLTSLQAHAYGLSWYENTGKDGAIEFQERKILGEKPADNAYGVCFTQMHSIDLADVDRDGVLDIVTGKRFWAHNGNDPGGNEPPVLYWFKTVRKADGSVDFVPHLIDDSSGVGTQVTAGDVSGDGKVDIVVGNKKGTFVFVQE